MIVYLPENLDLDKLITEANNKGKKFKKDYFAYIIGMVANGLYYQQNETENDITAPLWTLLLRRNMGDSYKIHLDYLVEHGILVTSNQFTKGNSRRYTFKEGPGTIFKQYQLTNAGLLRKVTTHFEAEKKSATRKYAYLYKWLKFGKLSIDYKGVQDILPVKFESKIQSLGTKMTKKEKYEIANLSLCCWKRTIETRHAKTYTENFLIGDSGGGRLYTTLTNTSRSFRKFIKFEGQTLCHVDVANSQPYFAMALLNINFWNSFIVGADTRRRVSAISQPNLLKRDILISKKIKDKLSFTDYRDLYILLNSSNVGVNQEFETYKKFVSSGKFYQELANQFNQSTVTNKPATVADVKILMFGVFFSENVILLWTERKASRLFRELFPSVSAVFRIIKRNRHNTLALLLQNLESQAVLRHACGSIAQKHPEIPLFTIHDSIVTTVGNEGIVRDIMHQELEAFTGLPPKLKTKFWDESYDE